MREGRTKITARRFAARWQAKAYLTLIVRGAVESSAAASLFRCGNAQRRGVTCVRVELKITARRFAA